MAGRPASSLDEIELGRISDGPSSCAWYHGELSEADSEKLLRRSGDYLLRDDPTGSGLVLSFRSNNGPHHSPVTRSGRLYALFPSQYEVPIRFSKLSDLSTHLAEQPVHDTILHNPIYKGATAVSTLANPMFNMDDGDFDDGEPRYASLATPSATEPKEAYKDARLANLLSLNEQTSRIIEHHAGMEKRNIGMVAKPTGMLSGLMSRLRGDSAPSQGATLKKLSSTGSSMSLGIISDADTDFYGTGEIEGDAETAPNGACGCRPGRNCCCVRCFRWIDASYERKVLFVMLATVTLGIFFYYVSAVVRILPMQNSGLTSDLVSLSSLCEQKLPFYLVGSLNNPSTVDARFDDAIAKIMRSDGVELGTTSVKGQRLKAGNHSFAFGGKFDITNEPALKETIQWWLHGQRITVKITADITVRTSVFLFPLALKTPVSAEFSLKGLFSNEPDNDPTGVPKVPDPNERSSEFRSVALLPANETLELRAAATAWLSNTTSFAVTVPTLFIEVEYNGTYVAYGYAGGFSYDRRGADIYAEGSIESNGTAGAQMLIQDFWDGKNITAVVRGSYRNGTANDMCFARRVLAGLSLNYTFEAWTGGKPAMQMWRRALAGAGLDSAPAPATSAHPADSDGHVDSRNAPGQAADVLAESAASDGDDVIHTNTRAHGDHVRGVRVAAEEKPFFALEGFELLSIYNNSFAAVTNVSADGVTDFYNFHGPIPRLGIEAVIGTESVAIVHTEPLLVLMQQPKLSLNLSLVIANASVALAKVRRYIDGRHLRLKLRGVKGINIATDILAGIELGISLNPPANWTAATSPSPSVVVENAPAWLTFGVGSGSGSGSRRISERAAADDDPSKRYNVSVAVTSDRDAMAAKLNVEIPRDFLGFRLVLHPFALSLETGGFNYGNLTFSGLTDQSAVTWVTVRITDDREGERIRGVLTRYNDEEDMLLTCRGTYGDGASFLEFNAPRTSIGSGEDEAGDSPITGIDDTGAISAGSWLSLRYLEMIGAEWYTVFLSIRATLESRFGVDVSLPALVLDIHADNVPIATIDVRPIAFGRDDVDFPVSIDLTIVNGTKIVRAGIDYMDDGSVLVKVRGNPNGSFLSRMLAGYDISVRLGGGSDAVATGTGGVNATEAASAAGVTDYSTVNLTVVSDPVSADGTFEMQLRDRAMDITLVWGAINITMSESALVQPFSRILVDGGSVGSNLAPSRFFVRVGAFARDNGTLIRTLLTRYLDGSNVGFLMNGTVASTRVPGKMHPIGSSISFDKSLFDRSAKAKADIAAGKADDSSTGGFGLSSVRLLSMEDRTVAVVANISLPATIGFNVILPTLSVVADCGQKRVRTLGLVMPNVDLRSQQDLLPLGMGITVASWELLWNVTDEIMRGPAPVPVLIYGNANGNLLSKMIPRILADISKGTGTKSRVVSRASTAFVTKENRTEVDIYASSTAISTDFGIEARFDLGFGDVFKLAWNDMVLSAAHPTGGNLGSASILGALVGGVNSKLRVNASMTGNYTKNIIAAVMQKDDFYVNLTGLIAPAGVIRADNILVPVSMMLGKRPPPPSSRRRRGTRFTQWPVDADEQTADPWTDVLDFRTPELWDDLRVVRGLPPLDDGEFDHGNNGNGNGSGDRRGDGSGDGEARAAHSRGRRDDSDTVLSSFELLRMSIIGADTVGSDVVLPCFLPEYCEMLAFNATATSVRGRFRVSTPNTNGIRIRLGSSVGIEVEANGLVLGTATLVAPVLVDRDSVVADFDVSFAFKSIDDLRATVSAVNDGSDMTVHVRGDPKVNFLSYAFSDTGKDIFVRGTTNSTASSTLPPMQLRLSNTGTKFMEVSITFSIRSPLTSANIFLGDISATGKYGHFEKVAGGGADPSRGVMFASVRNLTLVPGVNNITALLRLEYTDAYSQTMMEGLLSKYIWELQLPLEFNVTVRPQTTGVPFSIRTPFTFPEKISSSSFVQSFSVNPGSSLWSSLTSGKIAVSAVKTVKNSLQWPMRVLYMKYDMNLVDTDGVRDSGCTTSGPCSLSSSLCADPAPNKFFVTTISKGVTTGWASVIDGKESLATAETGTIQLTFDVNGAVAASRVYDEYAVKGSICADVRNGVIIIGMVADSCATPVTCGFRASIVFDWYDYGLAGTDTCGLYADTKCPFATAAPSLRYAPGSSFTFSAVAPNSAAKGSGTGGLFFPLSITAGSSQTGSVWFRQPLPVYDSFTANFTYRFFNKGSFGWGEGLAFVVQTSTQGYAALGKAGGSTTSGYAYDSIARSMAIAIDSYACNEMNVYANGDVSAAVYTTYSVAGAEITSGSSNTNTLTITYDAPGKRLSIEQNGRKATTDFDMAKRVPLFANGTAIVGFTGATGTLYSQGIEVSSFSFNPVATGGRRTTFSGIASSPLQFQQAWFLFQARDSCGRTRLLGGDQWVVMLESTAAATVSIAATARSSLNQVRDLGNGRYNVTFVSPARGRYNVRAILVSGQACTSEAAAKAIPECQTVLGGLFVRSDTA